MGLGNAAAGRSIPSAANQTELPRTTIYHAQNAGMSIPYKN
jgi:hypothetical protein